MERKKLFNILSLVTNILVVVLVTWAVCFYFFHTGTGNMLAHGTQYFRFFTIDSNILAAIASLIYIYFNVMKLIGKDIQIPNWLRIFKFVATNTVAVTFFVVLFLLTPMSMYQDGASFWFLYEDNCAILHGVGPILAMLTLIVFEKDDLFEKKYTYFQFVPVALYGLIYLICVVFAKVWPDFYGFTFDGRYYLSPIAAILVFGVSYGAAELMYFLQKLCKLRLQ